VGVTLSKIMKCPHEEPVVEDEHGEMVPVEYTPGEVLRPVMGTHKQSELHKFAPIWVKERNNKKPGHH
jgi:hypothetical protein